MRTVIVRDATRITLGKQGENNAVRVVWEGVVDKYAKLYGEGHFELVVVQRGQAYPAVVNVDGDDLVWDVRAADTATAEVGSLELIYYAGDTIVKSKTWETVVVASKSADGMTEPPEDPARAWFDAIKRQIGDLSKLTTKAKENLVAAINEAATTGSGGGSVEMRVDGGYIQYSTDGVMWENLISVASLEGKPGKDGAPGAPGAPGPIGTQGPQGRPGSNGKTAYQYAQDGGYTGSETEFAAKLAAEHLPVPATAAVGQYFKVKTVDGNGLVTEVEAADAPTGGGEAHFPKFELLHTHVVSEEESTSVVRWDFGLNEIPNLNDYNALNTVIRSPDGSNITLSAWVRFAINGAQCGMFCGSPNGKGSTYCVPANRLYGNWIAGYYYDATKSNTALVAKGARDVQETTIDASVPVTKISVFSYTSGFGMVAGTIIEIYGAK